MSKSNFIVCQIDCFIVIVVMDTVIQYQFGCLPDSPSHWIKCWLLMHQPPHLQCTLHRASSILYLPCTLVTRKGAKCTFSWSHQFKCQTAIFLWILNCTCWKKNAIFGWQTCWIVTIFLSTPARKTPDIENYWLCLLDKFSQQRPSFRLVNENMSILFRM